MPIKFKEWMEGVKGLPAKLGESMKAVFSEPAGSEERRRAPTRELPKISIVNSSKDVKEMVRDIVPKMRRELSALFRVAQTKPKRFIVIAFNQARIEAIYAESIATGIKVLAGETVKISPKHSYRVEAIERFISDFLSKNAIPEREAVLSIPGEESVVIHHLELPVLPRAEVLNAGKWKLKEDIPFDLELATIDWKFVRERIGRDGSKNHEYIFTVAQKDAVNQYLSLLGKSELHPVCVTVGPCNYANVLVNQPDLPRVSAVLDTDYAHATLSIYVDGSLCFVRRLPVSWKTFTRALTRILVSEEGPVNLTEEEAEKLQATVGIPLDESEGKDTVVRKTNVMFLLRPVLEALVRELKLSFNYFAVNFDIEKPRALFLAKSGLRLKNLERYLERELHINVGYLTLPDCVEMPASDESEEEGFPGRDEIVNAAGAALGDLKGMNLLPWEIKAQRFEFMEKVVLRFIGFSAAIILMFLILGVKARINDYRNRIEIANVHLRVIGGMKVLKEDLRLKEDLIERIQKGKVPARGLLKMIGVVIPEPVVLKYLGFEQTNHHLVLQGAVMGGPDTTGTVLADLMQRLEDSSFVEEARLMSSRQGSGNQEFEISCDLAY